MVCRRYVDRGEAAVEEWLLVAWYSHQQLWKEVMEDDERKTKPCNTQKTPK